MDGYVGPATESCQRSEMAKIETKSDVRAEIDMSAPFESVKEAVCRFGGVGYWKPSNKPFENEQHEVEEISSEKLEEQAAQLENELILKQRETLDLLQELESTRALVEDLKMELSEVSNMNTNVAAEEEDKENNGGQSVKIMEGFKQAQRNLTRTTAGISSIRASMEIFIKELERLKQNSLKMSSVEERLNQVRQKLQASKDSSNMDEDGTEILKELQNLNSEAAKFKQMGEAAKSEILRTISKIERKKAKIRTAESKSLLQQLEKGSESKRQILKQVKEATEEIKSTKFALEEVLNSMEAAKREELAVKEAAEKWGWEAGKNMEYRTQKPDGHESAAPLLKPTLSIGQILSRKLFLQEEMMSSAVEKGFLRRKVSLAQMLGKQSRDMSSCVKVEWRESSRNQSNRKRKKSGIAGRFPFLAKQNGNQKRKKPTPNLK